ncbi:hypothetical protein EMCG_00263 [[Emmonsia] crescens]|uniref:Uncharacterized protein n=1 Tax=[Emmonsia] crescens TaxID=73230 RepID=A0A0G2HZK3_9EURO|nr:hypothetical protein EMCG_00263 [Emmonsia crescens UAMH 3008]
MSKTSKSLQDSLMQQKTKLEEVFTMLPEVPNQLTVLAQEISDVLKAITDATVYSQGLSSDIQAIRSESDGRVLDGILDWLSPLEPSKTHQDVRSMRLEGTCEWVLETAEFLDWLSDTPSNRALYCYGDPGAGKTFLTSFVIDQISTHKQRGSLNNIGLAFVYCDCQDQSEQSVVNLAGGLLKQWLISLPNLPEEVKNIYIGKYIKGRLSLELSDAVHMLKLACSYFDRSYICIDALDECNDLAGLMELLVRLPSVQICVMSRRHLKEAVQHHINNPLSITVVAKQDDIHLYVKSKINEDRVKDSDLMDERLEKEISNKISKLSTGIFLLPALQLRIVLEARTKSKRRAALASLSSGLSEAFSSTMERINSQPQASAAQAKKILMWIYLARRPLHLDELMHALATEEIGADDFDQDNFPSKTSFLNCCLGLVVVDEETSKVRLVHHSLREYFDSAKGKGLFPNGHEIIAQTCLTYLFFRSTTNTEAKAVLSVDKPRNLWKSKFALYRYAASNWGYHTRKSSPPGERTIKLAERYLSLDREMFCFSVSHLSLGIANREGLENVASFSPLHLISFLGLPQMLNNKFVTPTTINEQDSSGRTSLLLAAVKRRVLVTQLLLKRGAEPNLAAIHGETPLSCAAENGYGKIINILLAHGAHLESKQGFLQQTPLALAAKNGRKDAVKLLLDAGANVNCKDVSGAEPLSLAVTGGYEDVVKLLLEKGAGNRIKDTRFSARLLRISIMNGHRAIARILLKQGVEFRPGDPSGTALLSQAAESGFEDVVQLLLQHGAGCTLKNS